MTRSYYAGMKTKRGLLRLAVFEILITSALTLVTLVLSGSLPAALIIGCGSLLYSLGSIYMYYQQLRLEENEIE